MKGRMPIGYYKDPERSSSTFVERDGERWSVPGDWVEIEADGTLRLHGRGSLCINSGGEKVFPEEVEEVMKLHPDVADAAVLGMEDPTFGEVVTAVVAPEPGALLIRSEVLDHTAQHLARYKLPKVIVVLETLDRAPNGKLDYQRLKAIMKDRMKEPTG
jgi:acyl-CoA synthetase (AMP-forming)/AMP-acid ligase II